MIADLAERAAQARERLRRRKESGAGFVECGPDADLVVEGPPRSANSFTVRMLHRIFGSSSGFRVAHHSHSPDNIWAGAGYGIPVVVLARGPENAIASYCIWSGRAPREAALRYARFYEGLAGLEGHVVGHFDEITGDFAAFLGRVAAVMPMPVPPVDDLPRLVAKVKAERQAISDAKRARAGIALATGAERERVRAEVRERVVEYLAGEPRAREAYARFVGGGGGRQS